MLWPVWLSEWIEHWPRRLKGPGFDCSQGHVTNSVTSSSLALTGVPVCVRKPTNRCVSLMPFLSLCLSTSPFHSFTHTQTKKDILRSGLTKIKLRSLFLWLHVLVDPSREPSPYDYPSPGLATTSPIATSDPEVEIAPHFAKGGVLNYLLLAPLSILNILVGDPLTKLLSLNTNLMCF